MRHRGSGGFSLTEVMVALLVLATVVSASLTVFMMANRQATLTRMRAGAVIIAESFFEEVADHEYGDPPYSWWPQRGGEPAEIVFPSSLAGVNASQKYRLSVSYKNGSFVDPTKTNRSDTITLTVTWSNKEAQPLVVSKKVWRAF